MGGDLAALAAQGSGIPARATFESSCNAADGGDADVCQVVDFPIWHALQQPWHDFPAIGHRLQFGRGAQVRKKCVDLGCTAQTGQCQGQPGDCIVVIVWLGVASFHGLSNAL